MGATTPRFALGPLILSVLLIAHVSADEVGGSRRTGVVNPRTLSTPREVISQLQENHLSDESTFVVQKELDFLIAENGGGACASAAAIDLLQVLRLMAGLEKLPNPHKAALAAFEAQRHLLKGRVTNDSLVNLIRFYERQLDGRTLRINVESAPNSTHATEGPRWSLTRGPDLKVAPLQLKILSYTVTDKDGTVIGRHFVLLKRTKKNEIVVLDPTSPAKDRSYILEFRGRTEERPCEQVFLHPPAGIPTHGYTFELNTIFRVSLSGGEPASGATKSVEEIKEKIDQTADELRGTAEFLSPRVWREKTASFGLPALDLPTELGGANWPPSKMVEVFRHAGRQNLNFRDIVGGAHVRPLLKSSHPEIREIVRQVGSGKGYVAIAITEPGAGTDMRSMASTSKKVEGGYLLTGTKRFNARLDQATHLILFAQGTTGKKGKLSVFVVPIGTPGLTIETLSAHGLVGNSYGGVRFKDLFVPDSHLIGEDGEGFAVFFDHFLYWRLMQTAAAIGTGEQALEQMVDRIKTRQAFGGPIGRFTHLQQPVGQHTTELRMAFSLVRETAKLLDKGDYRGASAMICGLKAEGVEVALNAVDAATRAFGGEGYSNLVDLGDRLRDLNGLRIADGTTDVMRMEVVRQVYGRELWEMAVQAKE